MARPVVILLFLGLLILFAKVECLCSQLLWNFLSLCAQIEIVHSLSWFMAYGYRGGSPTTVQAW